MARTQSLAPLWVEETPMERRPKRNSYGGENSDTAGMNSGRAGRLS